MPTRADDPTAEVTDLLQSLIRNRCVNDGTVASGEETKSVDLFAGEVVEGFVWGRGAVDMLNLTASQAVAFRRLADSGFRPKGTLIYLAVADEEALGRWG